MSSTQLQKNFSEIANKYGGAYVFRQQFSNTFDGLSIPVDYHILTLTYRSIPIRIQYEFGSTTLGEINCSIETVKTIPEFAMSTRSNFTRLFTKNKNPFIVKCNDPMFKAFVNNLLVLSYYNALANNTTFEPEIVCTTEQGRVKIKTVYYLGFGNVEEALEPTIELYQKIIDKVLR